ncbi:hypothetical protein BSL78_06988 [Apostichopus japonicus]|uniref:Uncharacterized protein n=1 Tax=Stichopus japonicus TaxID=307972 RepID=A0A2G8L751_STIJA|nr:hypothetical protein BSL78_06988 [Apostichopus japonicus]
MEIEIKTIPPLPPSTSPTHILVNKMGTCLNFKGGAQKSYPAEAELLRDPSIRARVRFRFAGAEFPPIVLFKIYTHTEGTGLRYMSGKKCIRPASDAASDACRMMGHRLFYDQMIADTCQQEQDQITDEVDVTTTKDYMQYLSNLDEMPAHMGGRDNLWRRLDLNVLPRTTILYDILDFVENGKTTPRLHSEFRVLTTRPVTQEMQLEHIKLISKIRTPEIWTPTPRQPPKSGRQSQPGETARRSRQATLRANRMKKMYADGKREEWIDSGGGVPSETDGREEEEDWEREADKLFEWTQGLSYDDIGFASPS